MSEKNVIIHNKFDRIEVHTNVTIQILINSETDEYSIGWTSDKLLAECWTENAHKVINH